MARVAGINLPLGKHIVIALTTSIYGIGLPHAKQVCVAAGVNPETKVKDLSEAIIDKIRLEVGKYKIEGELRREIASHKRRLQVIRCYRGIRHLCHLPVRGQRTRTNARTRKGPRKIIRKN